MTAAARANSLLLLTSGIWGFAFVAQRMGMDHVGPLLFNGVRFAIGGLFLLGLTFLRGPWYPPEADATWRRSLWLGGGVAGIILFAAATLQQVGIVYTTAGKAGFITGLYVVIVPLLGLFLKQAVNRNTWLGVILAAVGMYFLSVNENFTLQFGDLLELIGAAFWAVHVHLVGYVSTRTSATRFAIVQFLVCAVLSLLVSMVRETTTLVGLRGALIPILYGGLLSVGIGYTLQVVAQKDANPTHAAIILSLESVFAAIGGWIILSEQMTGRSFLGCMLMLAGMVLSQLPPPREEPAPHIAS